MITVAALFVETDGCYFGMPDIDPWDITRDARKYAGPWPVVAHPPCQRWGRYSENHPIKGLIAVTGNDGDCFASALRSVRKFGGVIEHPKDSKAFVGKDSFDLGRPSPDGWTRSWDGIGWICQVEQGHYGHFSRKATWLYTRIAPGFHLCAGDVLNSACRPMQLNATATPRPVASASWRLLAARTRPASATPRRSRSATFCFRLPEACQHRSKQHDHRDR